MGLNYVRFVETIPTRDCLNIHDDSFSYQPKRGWAPVQRACFWLLKRLGCYHATSWTSYRRIDVDPDITMQEIFRQQASLAGSLGRGGEVLLIGADDWSEIMRQQGSLYSVMVYDGEYYVPRHVDLDGRRTPPLRKKMRVCVIPWMKGMVLVPREALDPVKQHVR